MASQFARPLQVEERWRIIRFWNKKRKSSLVMISISKIVIFYGKLFHMMKGVKIKCFITLKTPENKYEL